MSVLLFTFSFWFYFCIYLYDYPSIIQPIHFITFSISQMNTIITIHSLYNRDTNSKYLYMISRGNSAFFVFNSFSLSHSRLLTILFFLSLFLFDLHWTMDSRYAIFILDFDTWVLNLMFLILFSATSNKLEIGMTTLPMGHSIMADSTNSNSSNEKKEHKTFSMPRSSSILFSILHFIL